MKKSFIVFSFLLFFANCFSSENKNFSIEIKPSFGLIFGRASEYVHVDYEKFLDVGSYNARLSQLDYDYKAPCVNLDIDSQIFKNFYIGVTATLTTSSDSLDLTDRPSWHTASTAARKNSR